MCAIIKSSLREMRIRVCGISMNDVEIPESDELDYREIAKVLGQLRERYYQDGDDMADPEDWWNKKIGTLSIRVATRAQLEWLDGDRED